MKTDFNQIYKEVADKYFKLYVDSRSEKVKTVLLDLHSQSLRGLVIIGSAYIEELCKECFLFTLSKGERRKKFEKDLRREMTFSLTSTFLWSQDYFANNVYEIISCIRDVRNKLAHNAIIEQSHSDYIEARAKKIIDLVQDRWIAANLPEKINFIPLLKLKCFDDNKLYNGKLKNEEELKEIFFKAISDIVVGLIILSKWIIPEQKLIRLSLEPGSEHIGVTFFEDRFDHNTLGYFDDKFKLKE
ncbi:hypothetical protein [Pontibacter burrus]|uniref:Uncharacterized protein n=1 Tax=Pontibacter burrus TaxID=2704466 RepID=A0A6B3LRK2_9BACT|nr:hypothetical protein [Pontibacter burrus]NEM99459.1 hypothetical protein [Pontibacter burrus]